MMKKFMVLVALLVFVASVSYGLTDKLDGCLLSALSPKKTSVTTQSNPKNKLLAKKSSFKLPPAITEYAVMSGGVRKELNPDAVPPEAARRAAIESLRSMAFSAWNLIHYYGSPYFADETIPTDRLDEGVYAHVWRYVEMNLQIMERASIRAAGLTPMDPYVIFSSGRDTWTERTRRNAEINRDLLEFLAAWKEQAASTERGADYTFADAWAESGARARAASWNAYWTGFRENVIGFYESCMGMIEELGGEVPDRFPDPM